MKNKLPIQLYISLLSLLFSLPSLAQTTVPAFVQQDMIKVLGVTTDAQINSLTAGNIQTTRTYTDGFGRPVQTIMLQASPINNKDIVQFQVYNALGQQTTGYLPYVDNTANYTGSYRTAPITDQYNYYHGNTGGTNKVAGDDKAYSQQVFENSPLQRVLAAGSVGSGFQPNVSANHWKTANYRSNTTADAVWNWDATGTKQSSNYTAGLLSVTEGVDENGVKSTMFTDLAGRTILKRQQADETVNGVSVPNFDTYYVYNLAGQVSYVIPPRGVTAMVAAGNYSLTQAGVNELVFSYVYDAMGRLSSKKVPGAAAIAIIYDPLNRPVLMQDANLKANNKWNYIKYDAEGRVISQGIYVDATYTTPVAMQTHVSGLTSYNTTYFESRNTSATNGYYSNSVFPTANITPLAYSYYDDYDFNNDGTNDYNFNPQGYSLTATALTRGMVTGIKQKTVGTGMTAVWLSKVLYYDKNGRQLQVQSNNVLNTTVADFNTIQADFTGKPRQVSTVKTVPAGATTVISSFSYDNWSRPTAIDQQYTYNSTTSATFHIAKYIYNEMGQLVDKQLGATSSLPAGMQSVDYRYNIRGQLMSINNSRLGTTDSKNDDTNDIFGMELMYDVADANITGSTADYTGRISAVKWMSKNTAGTVSNERSYYYSYDKLNRLKGGVYAERVSATGAFSTGAGGFDEKSINYDENGNIMGLQRNQLVSTTVSSIDQLTYGYDATNPNRLLTVTDNAPAATKAQGFNQNGSGGGYAYYASGNLQTDPYKGLSLTYNDLNRTDVVTVTAARSLSYVYDASGVVVRKKQTDTGTGVTTTTDYIDGFVYLNGTLSYLSMPEGRVLYNGGSLKPEYIISDNQGNARVSFTDNGSGGMIITQENSYYGFGMALSGNSTTSGANKNLYNGGSEVQNDFGNMPDFYQTFYRNYDAAIGRWMAVDPMAEGDASSSVFQYSGNNPVMFNDPLGNIVAEAGMNPIGIPQQHTGNALNNFNPFLASNSAFNGDGSPIINTSNNGSGGGVYGGFWNAIFYSNKSFAEVLKAYRESGTEGKNGTATYIDGTGAVSFLPSGTDSNWLYTMNANSAWLPTELSSGGANQGGNANESPVWYDFGSKANTIFGAGTTAMAPFITSSVAYARAGAPFVKYYSRGWGGGSKALISTVKTVEVLPYIGFFAGLAMDGVAVGNHDIGWGKFSLNQTMGLAGFSGVLAPLSITYFGLDGFYPGGINGAVNAYGKVYQDNPSYSPTFSF